MTKAEKAATKILSTINIRKGGPRMIYLPKRILRELLVVAYKTGLVDGIKDVTAAIGGKKRGKRGT